jgi:hypothetical protein
MLFTLIYIKWIVLSLKLVYYGSSITIYSHYHDQILFI